MSGDNRKDLTRIPKYCPHQQPQKWAHTLQETEERGFTHFFTHAHLQPVAGTGKQRDQTSLCPRGAHDLCGGTDKKT